MSAGKKRRTIYLNEVSRDHLEMMREAIDGRLRAQAADLDALLRERDPRAVLDELGALGRLSSWLHVEIVEVPDPAVHAIVAKLAEELDRRNEEIVRRYEEATAEGEAINRLRVLTAAGLEPPAEDEAGQRGARPSAAGGEDR